MTTPPLPDLCWPIDSSCCSDWGDYSADLRDRASALAAQTMRALTGYQVGGCPVTVRPCARTCVDGNPYAYAWFEPYLYMGVWRNVACGCLGGDGCSCSYVCEVVLPGPVGAVDQVTLGEEILDPFLYRVDDSRVLVWEGGGDCPFPKCQDMAAPIGSPGTFSVTYLRGHPVDGLGAYAAGVLACEYVRACSGQSCRLPTRVTSIARQGVAYEVQSADFPNMLTGIPDVDSYLMRWNPYGRRSASTVWYPGMGAPRQTTWMSQ